MSCQLRESIMESETTTVMMLENTCVSALESMLETLSTSLDRRLISSPCVLESKKRSGSFCKR